MIMGVLRKLECLPSTSEVTGLNLALTTSCWKVGSYLPNGHRFKGVTHRKGPNTIRHINDSVPGC